MTIEANIDIEWLKGILDSITDLETDEEIFGALAQLQTVKDQLDEAYEALGDIESEVKSLINNKAKALYGPEWEVIKGHGFKISRSKTGDKYNLTGETVATEFVKIKQSVNSKAVEEYITENQKLPDGIEINVNRGESIRIKVEYGQETDPTVG